MNTLTFQACFYFGVFLSVDVSEPEENIYALIIFRYINRLLEDENENSFELLSIDLIS